MSIPTDGEFSSSVSGAAGPDRPAAESESKTSAPPPLTTRQNGVLAAGVVLVIGVWIAGGWAFVDSFRNPPPPKLAPSAAEKSAPSAAEKSAPSEAEKSTPPVAESPPVAEKSAAAADKPSAATKPAEPTALAVVATDNPPEPPEPQPLPGSQPSPTSQAATPPLASPPAAVDDEVADPTARELITRGWALYYLPYIPVRWPEARHDFERALEVDPRSIEARIGLASILSAKLADGWSPVLQENIPRAERLLLEIIDNGNVSNPTAHFTLGVLRQMQNRLPEAQAEFELAISLDHNNPRTYLHLGETLLYLGQPQAGIPLLEQAIRLRPDDPNAAITYWALGTCQLLLGRVDQAIDLLQTARAANARFWVPYFYLAGAYGLRDDLDKARSAIAESLRLKPAMKSLARMRVENPWLSNLQYWALQEQTLNVGLRRIDFPDQ